jgi:metal-responsive CopG/Arc/MetJ family transcriptional regulator
MNESEKLVQFNCPVKLLELFDEVITGEYNNRTTALVYAMRQLIGELEENKRNRKIALKKGAT